MKYKDCGSLLLKELISITLRESNDSPVVGELLQRFSTISDLYRASVYELTTIKGLGLARANALKASLELGRRLYTVQPEQLPSIRTPQDVATLLINEMRYFDREHFRVILLNAKNRVLSIETVSVGTLNSSAVHPRELFKPAIRNSAAAVILVHNHPSGDPTPSRQDITVTERLKEAGEILGIEVLDHVVVGDGVFVSLKEKGLI